MTTRIIINDYKENRRFYINLEKEDFDIVETYWDQTDQLLQALQGEDFFKGHATWGLLSPTHYRLLIIKNLSTLVALSEDARSDRENNIVRSLRFLVTALVYCLEIRSETIVELMKITRMDEYQVSFDYVSNINLPIKSPSKIVPVEPEKKFTVIIDNESGE